MTAEAQSVENLLELHSLRLAMLLLSVCHLVIVVEEGLDLRALRVLSTPAEALEAAEAEKATAQEEADRRAEEDLHLARTRATPSCL